MRRIIGKKLGAGIMALLLLFGTFFQTVSPVRAEETGTDITGKVTIDSISSPNAEIKDSTNVNDFSSSVESGGTVDYKIDLTVNKGTPIETGDFIEIPVKADRGDLFESHGLLSMIRRMAAFWEKRPSQRVRFESNSRRRTMRRRRPSSRLQRPSRGLAANFQKASPRRQR